jgi:hypothetical protein
MERSAASSFSPKKEALRPFGIGAPLFEAAFFLEYFYIGRRGTLLTFFNVKAHALTLLQSFETVTLDGAEVHKYILALIRLDEAKTF